MTPRSPRVVEAAKLKRRNERTASGRFLAEGPNLVEAAARRGLVEAVFATESAAQRYRTLLAGLEVHTCSDSALKALSDTVTPAGVVATCRLPQHNLDEVLSIGAALVVVAVDISDPGNAGTLIRLADAMGTDAVVFAGEAVDPYNGKCVRSSAGSIVDIPVVCEQDTAGVVAKLSSAGLQVFATTLNGSDLSLDEAEPLLASPTAWVFGPEARGLSPAIAELADRRVRIPMSGSAESLNVATAAAICLYQSARAQRRARSGA